MQKINNCDLDTMNDSEITNMGTLPLEGKYRCNFCIKSLCTKAFLRDSHLCCICSRDPKLCIGGHCDSRIIQFKSYVHSECIDCGDLRLCKDCLEYFKEIYTINKNNLKAFNADPMTSELTKKYSDTISGTHPKRRIYLCLQT